MGSSLSGYAAFAIYDLPLQVVNNLGALGITAGFLTTFNSIGGAATFWIFAACTLCSLAFVYKFVPETLRKEPEEISAALRTHCTCCGKLICRRDSYEPKIVKGRDLDDDAEVSIEFHLPGQLIDYAMEQSAQHTFV